MSSRTRDSLVITLAYVAAGPALAFFLHAIPFATLALVLNSASPSSFRSVLSQFQFNGIFFLVLLYYYGFGIIPAIATAEVTKLIIRRTGRTIWWISALVGSFASLPISIVSIIVGFPQLVIIGQDFSKASLSSLPVTFATGFLATAVCWLLVYKQLNRYTREIAVG